MITNYLRKAIKAKLSEVSTSVYYQIADRDAMFPHIVFTLETATMMETDSNRFDYSLVVDVYHKNKPNDAEDLTDSVINKLNNLNLPNTNVLPTFFLESRRTLIDEDKNINHRQLTFVVQAYERN